MCLGSLGNLYLQRGSLTDALELHRQHLDLARREGLREMEAYALVDLCATSFMLDRGEDGFSYAREALILVGPGSPLLQRLAHDLAMYLLDSRGDFENALLLFQALQRYEFPREERLLLASSLARAAAGAGQAQLFEDTWKAVWSELNALPVAECPSLPFLMLAHGALIRGYYGFADEAARRGLAVASARGEQRHVSGAEGLIEAAAVARKTQARAPAPRHPTHDGHTAARLTRDFVAGLRKGAARSSRAAYISSASSSRVEF